MGVDAFEPEEFAGNQAVVLELGDIDLVLVPDNDVYDLAGPVDQKGDLPSDLMGDLGHLPADLRRYDIL